MKIKVLAVVALSFVSMSSWGSAVEYCPSVGAIKHEQGIYSASTQSGEGEWLGVSSVGKPTAIKSFEIGTFYPVSDDESKGLMNKCAYLTESGDHVDLRYRPEQKDRYVELVNKAQWKRYESGFGIVTFECASKVDGACSFKEI